MLYRVAIREVHVSHRIVEASSEAEAKDLAADADDEFTEYSHTLDKDLWTVESGPQVQLMTP